MNGHLEELEREERKCCIIEDRERINRLTDGNLDRGADERTDEYVDQRTLMKK